MADVLGYLESKGLFLKRADSRNIHTACVFCDEPSDARGRLYINTDPDSEIPGLYLCHRCGAKGNLTTLKRHFGDGVHDNEVDTAVRSEILNRAAAFYQAQLAEYPEVISYLKGRGLTMETIARHELGYAPMERELAPTVVLRRPRQLYRFLRSEDYRPRDIVGTGLCHADERTNTIVDSLWGMVTIPYHVAGNVVGIRGRAWPHTEEDFASWNDEPYDPPKGKYKTCSGARTRLFNSDAMWGRDDICITEGEFDALILEQEGFPAVGVPGANVWQDAWDDYVKALQRVYIVFDRDAAGEKAADALVDRFGAKARRVFLSEEGAKCDPTEWFAEGHSAEEFQTLLDEANKGGLLVTVAEAIVEFSCVQALPGLKFGWDLFDTMIAPGLQPAQLMVPLAKTGVGKGHPWTTPVSAPDGVRRWGDLQPGDEIFGADGLPTKVVAVYDRGVLSTYRVSFSDGTSVETDGDHIWTVMYRYGRRREWTRKNLTTAELAVADLRRGPEYRYTIPMCGPVQYPAKDLPVEPYTLGALIANGALTKTSAILVTPDEEVVRRVETTYRVSPHKRSEGACPSFTVLGLIGTIRRLGLTCLSVDKFIPDVYLTASVEQRIALLQGLLDGDGGSRAKESRRSIYYFTSSRRLADDVVQLVSSLGGTATQFWPSREGRRPECRLSIMLPTSIVPFSTSRRPVTGMMAYATEPRRAIVSVESVEPQPIRCITVDAPDSLYLIGREHIVTHNTIVVLNVMDNVRRQEGQEDAKILFVSLEQTRGEWWDRARRIHRFHDLEADEADAEAWWANNIMLVDRNRLSEAQLRQVIDDFSYQMGKLPDLVVIDYLGYWANSFRGERYQRTSDAVMALKAVAKDYRVPIISPHQVSRGAQDGLEFSSDAARDAGTVEETADFVVAMWAPDNAMGREDAERTGIIHLRLTKSRHGGRGQLFSMQFAPISLALVPEGHPLAGRARKEYSWKTKYHDDWHAAVHRHVTGFEGTLSRDMFGRVTEARRTRKQSS